MAKFDTQCITKDVLVSECCQRTPRMGSQIRFCYVEYCIPAVKTLLEEVREVVRDTQLREDISQFSHTAGCVWIERSSTFRFHRGIEVFEAACLEQWRSFVLSHLPFEWRTLSPSAVLLFVAKFIVLRPDVLVMIEVACNKGMDVCFGRTSLVLGD